MRFFKRNDSPPCITCSHCVEKGIFGAHSAGIPDYYEYNCELTPDRSGVFFMKCSKARKMEFCNYEKKKE